MNFELPKISRCFAIMLLSSLGLGLVPGVIHAQVLDNSSFVIQPAEVNIDTSSVQEDRSFSIPKKIVLTPIFLGDQTRQSEVQDDDWFRGLFYYLVAGDARSGFTDIPFHYVVTQRGRAFAANSGGEERKISIAGLGDDAVVIAYLAESSSTGFDIRAKESLTNLILQVANRHAINPSKISISGVKFVQDSAQQSVRLEEQDVYGLWKKELREIVSEVRQDYNPQARTYKIAVEEVILPEGKVDSGETIDGSVVVSNQGEYGIYGGTLAELIATKKNSGTSRFYVNNTWLSPTQFSLMQPEDVILPGEELELKFTLGTPLYFGEQKERFIIENLEGNTAGTTEFLVALDIRRPEGIIVQIQQTQTGWLRLRATPNGVENNEIGRVSSGERFYQIDDAGNGWIKIRLNDGTEGWVLSTYVDYI